ncbi:hypothetical protein Nmel_009178 [Mimus melanotis]
MATSRSADPSIKLSCTFPFITPSQYV